MNFFYNYSIDCELPPEGRFGGPASWEVAERSVRGFVQVMDELSLRGGTTLFVYPDVAQKQRALFREMAGAGIEIALHLNTMRYSRLQRPAWLGSMSPVEQREALGMAKADLEELIGQRCLGFRACYASFSHETFAVLEELGFAWTSTSASGSYKPDVFARWTGGWHFPYHPSRQNMLVPGSLRIYEMPIARGIRTLWKNDPDRPLDLRAETPPEVAGPQCEVFRRIIEENLEAMARCEQPVRGLFPASHNTNLFADRSMYQHEHLAAVCRMTQELAEARGYEFVPAKFLEVKAEADRIGAF